MSPHPKALDGAVDDAPAAVPAAQGRAKPMLWSVRRELWEHPSIYLAPLMVGGVSALVLVIRALMLPDGARAGLTVRDGRLAGLFWHTAAVMLFTGFFTGALYCLDALNGERRDRGILFWKSLPLSDLTVVLSKAAVAMVVLPLLTLGVALMLNVVTLLLMAAMYTAQGHGAGALWSEVAPFRMWTTLVYAVLAATLWHAPIYAFLLLVSGSARRTSALWVLLPVPAIIAAEVLTYNAFEAAWAKYRLMGWFDESFRLRALDHSPFHASTSLTPGGFFAAPGLWLGLLFAALCLFAAARLRRLRGPI